MCRFLFGVVRSAIEPGSTRQPECVCALTRVKILIAEMNARCLLEANPPKHWVRMQLNGHITQLNGTEIKTHCSVLSQKTHRRHKSTSFGPGVWLAKTVPKSKTQKSTAYVRSRSTPTSFLGLTKTCGLPRSILRGLSSKSSAVNFGSVAMYTKKVLDVLSRTLDYRNGLAQNAIQNRD